MQNKIHVPPEDLEAINESFKQDFGVETLGKSALGGLLVVERKIVNHRGYVISDFRGRTLKHMKSVVLENGRQVTVCIRGQKFEDIPEDLKKEVLFTEEDFL